MRADRAGLCPVPGCVKHPRHVGRHLIRFATGEDEGVAFLETIPEAGAARSDGAASGEVRTRRRRSQRSFSPLVESASGEESERTDETMSPRDDEGDSPAGASGEERDGAADDDPHQCHVPGCIKQARHVGRHKVRLPDGEGFVAAASFEGARTGFAFKTGSMGLGYYPDDRCLL